MRETTKTRGDDEGDDGGDDENKGRRQRGRRRHQQRQAQQCRQRRGNLMSNTTTMTMYTFAHYAQQTKGKDKETFIAR